VTLQDIWTELNKVACRHGTATRTLMNGARVTVTLTAPQLHDPPSQAPKRAR
jgi:hypothetical protein